MELKASVSYLRGSHIHSDMIAIFGRSVPEMISNQVTDWISNTHGHKVTLWNHGILNPPLIAAFADAVHSKRAALDNCIGFIDGTVRPISRPMSNQRVVYNGHKRVHALKFQDITLPNGLIGNIYGPVGKPQIFFSFTKQPVFPTMPYLCMEFLFHFTCLLLLPYFWVKVLFTINSLSAQFLVLMQYTLPASYMCHEAAMT